MEQHPFLVVPCAHLRLSEAARAAYGVTRAELDEFLMYEFKVRRCGKAYPHQWMKCPYAHRGEKARRRDPRRFPHHGVPCPEFRQSGACRLGHRCEFSHGVFEFWLHPTRYRTRMCISGPTCARKICFFAHSADELRPEAVSPAGDVAREATSSSEAAKRAEEPDIRWVYELVD
ncbi:zinc finger CCCH domain-containing protein 23-like [Curcuma longa]|uniref:zinc finger CCCH domain-containing protein 23-like n=1 Tax=Curcuma longa TaxID=136217 RepID=UPI003D9E1700